MRILLLEPDTVRRQNIALVLTTTGGYDVHACSTIKQAEIGLQQHVADLCLLNQRFYHCLSHSLPTILLGTKHSTDNSLLACIPEQAAITEIPQLISNALNRV